MWNLIAKFCKFVSLLMTAKRDFLKRRVEEIAGMRDSWSLVWTEVQKERFASSYFGYFGILK
jgi:hypothetical protein